MKRLSGEAGRLAEESVAVTEGELPVLVCGIGMNGGGEGEDVAGGSLDEAAGLIGKGEAFGDIPGVNREVGLGCGVGCSEGPIGTGERGKQEERKESGKASEHLGVASIFGGWGVGGWGLAA